ncbi:hypothetical protein NU219Hw_g5672t2 [Hortaea werneckii]
MLLRQVVGEREELKRELERKDTEIREAKEDRDATATHTHDVLMTLIDVHLTGFPAKRSGPPQHIKA